MIKKRQKNKFAVFEMIPFYNVLKTYGKKNQFKNPNGEVIFVNTKMKKIRVLTFKNHFSNFARM